MTCPPVPHLKISLDQKFDFHFLFNAIWRMERINYVYICLEILISIRANEK